MTKEPVSNQSFSLWSDRQGIITFILLMTLCLSFYVVGVYIGRLSNSSTATAATLSSKESKIVAANQLAPLTLPAQEAPKGDKTEAVKSVASEKYSIQVAATSTQEEADIVVDKLRKAGLDSAHIIAPAPNSVTQFFAVRVGPYDPKTAHQVAEELQKNQDFKGVQLMLRQTE